MRTVRTPVRIATLEYISSIAWLSRFNFVFAFLLYSLPFDMDGYVLLERVIGLDCGFQERAKSDRESLAAPNMQCNSA